MEKKGRRRTVRSKGREGETGEEEEVRRGEEEDRERRPPPLQGALTVRKYRAHHVAECTVEGDLDDPWYPRQP